MTPSRVRIICPDGKRRSVRADKAANWGYPGAKLARKAAQHQITLLKRH